MIPKDTNIKTLTTDCADTNRIEGSRVEAPVVLSGIHLCKLWSKTPVPKVRLLRAVGISTFYGQEDFPSRRQAGPESGNPSA